MGELAFEVREVHQTSSGGSHVVKYSAELEILDGQEPFSVEILNWHPPELDLSEEIENARQLIQRAAVRAFHGTGKAARIRVKDFVIHLVDYKARYVEEYTFRALCRVLGR